MFHKKDGKRGLIYGLLVTMLAQQIAIIALIPQIPHVPAQSLDWTKLIFFSAACILGICYSQTPENRCLLWIFQVMNSLGLVIAIVFLARKFELHESDYFVEFFMIESAIQITCAVLAYQIYRQIERELNYAIIAGSSPERKVKEDELDPQMSHYTIDSFL